MNDPASILKKDHREVEKLLKQLADAPEAKRAALVDKIDSALSLHMKIEEQLLYPLVPPVMGAEAEEEAEVEHGMAREGVTKLHAMLHVPGFGAAVDMLTAGIAHHVKEEETELFPKMKKGLSATRWARLGDEVAAAKDGTTVPAKKATKKATKPTAKKATSRAAKKSTATATSRKKATARSR
jgi:iron-sulfur cluster repair protein YtfE (RIC family)